jgi:hypothetical protein
MMFHLKSLGLIENPAVETIQPVLTITSVKPWPQVTLKKPAALLAKNMPLP